MKIQILSTCCLIFVLTSCSSTHTVIDVDMNKMRQSSAETLLTQLYSKSDMQPKDRILRIATLAIQFTGRDEPYGESFFLGARRWPIRLHPLTNRFGIPEHKQWFPGFDPSFLDKWYSNECDAKLFKFLENNHLIEWTGSATKSALSKQEQQLVLNKINELLNQIYP